MIMYLFLVLFLASLFFLKKLKSKSKKIRPGPKGYPFVKNTFEIKSNVNFINTLFSQYYDKFNSDTICMESFDVNWIATRDPENAKFIQSDIDSFVRRTPLDMTVKKQRYANLLFGQGIFLADGHDWKLQRIFATPVFRKKSLDVMVETFEKYGRIVLQVLGEAEKTGEAVDVQDLFNRYTMDSFGEIGFGVVFNSILENNPFPLAFDRCQNMLIELFMKPYYWYVENEEFRQNIDYLHSYVDKIIEQRKMLSREELASSQDILSRFLTEQENSGFDDKFLRDLVMNFIIAGKDTTAQLITWTCYNLATHPDLMEQVIKEVDTFGDNFARENLNTLPYLDNFIHEVLRLYPSVPRIIRRTCLESVILPDGFEVYHAEPISIDVYNIHRHPKYWDEPNTFNPDRWTSSPLKHPGQYIPFHGGPMVCIGKHLALAEAKLMIILLLQNYTVSVATEPQLSTSLILRSSNGVHLNLYKRNEN